MATTHQLSRAAYERLQAELEDLRGRGRIELADRIERARVAQLFGILENAVIVDDDAGHDGTVAPGCVVHIRFEGDDEVEVFYFGSIEEQHPDYPVMSTSSPLGEALAGSAEGATVSYATPTGAQVAVEVVRVER